MTQTTYDWTAQAAATLRDKRAATTNDDKAIAEAFAQQAYTAIGNRDREIMKDPYLLGFEVVDKNEDNNRLVGVFAFRVGGEILLAPVFYLNGQVKGQDLLYRKGVNRFVPNTEKWITYLLGKAEDQEGRGISRRAGQEARVDLGLSRATQPPGSYKRAGMPNMTRDVGVTVAGGIPGALVGAGVGAGVTGTFGKDWDPGTRKAVEFISKWLGAGTGMIAAKNLDDHFEPDRWDEEGRKIPSERNAKEAAAEGFTVWKSASAEVRSTVIQQLWKEAMEAWTVTEPEYLFADMVGNEGMGKAAAALAERHHEFAEFIEKGQLLTHAAPQKQASGLTGPSLVLHTEPPSGLDELGLETFYKRGFALTDERPIKNLAKAIDTRPTSETWTTLREAGVQKVTDAAGKECQVLWAPQFGDHDVYPSRAGSRNGSRNGLDREGEANHFMIFLDGPDKGCVKEYDRWGSANDLPMFQGNTVIDLGTQTVPGEKPKAGNTYMIWLPECKRLWGPLAVSSVDGKGDVTRLNFEAGNPWGATCRLLIRKDLDLTCDEDFNPAGHDTPRVCGKDAVFLPVKAELRHEHGCAPTDAKITGTTLTPPCCFIPLTLSKVNSALWGKTKQASVEIRKDASTGLHEIYFNGALRAEYLDTKRLAVKLARDLRLHADEAMAIAVKAATEKVSFEVVRNTDLPKMATELFKGAAMDVPNLDEAALEQLINAGPDAFDPGLAFHSQGIDTGMALGHNLALPAGRFQGALGTLAAGAPAYGAYKGYKHLTKKEEPEEDKLKEDKEARDGVMGMVDSAWNTVVPKVKEIGQGFKDTLITPAIKGFEQGVPTGGETPAVPVEPKENLMRTSVDPEPKKAAVPWAGAKSTPAPLPAIPVPGAPKVKIKTLPPAADSLAANLGKPRKTDGFYTVQDDAPKTAGAYFDQDLDPETHFDDYDYDSDLQIPVEFEGMNRHQAMAYHEQQPRPQARYRDAWEAQGGSNSRHLDHIPDEVILRMANPGMEMAQLGEQLGMGTLIDHGAVGSLTRVFDATPFITDYIGKLEGSLDYLARLLFMLFWKPRDFAKLFGGDDLPQLENKLTGVFTSYGDLTLELLQSAGDKTH